MVDINISKNKGEWSEVYAFLKLIAERRIVGAKNDALDPDKNQCLSILKVSRDEYVSPCLRISSPSNRLQQVRISRHLTIHRLPAKQKSFSPR